MRERKGKSAQLRTARGKEEKKPYSVRREKKGLPHRAIRRIPNGEREVRLLPAREDKKKREEVGTASQWTMLQREKIRTPVASNLPSRTDIGVGSPE